MHHVAGNAQRKNGYRHVEKARRCRYRTDNSLPWSRPAFQHCSTGVRELLILTESRLLARQHQNGNFLDFTAAVGDHDPASIQQLAGHRAMIANGNRVGKGISLFLTRGDSPNSAPAPTPRWLAPDAYRSTCYSCVAVRVAHCNAPETAGQWLRIHQWLHRLLVSWINSQRKAQSSCSGFNALDMRLRRLAKASRNTLSRFLRGTVKATWRPRC